MQYLCLVYDEPEKIYYNYARDILLSICYIKVIPGIYHTYLNVDEVSHGYAEPNLLYICCT